MLMHYMVPFERPVIDARLAPPGAVSLDKQGFQLISAPTQMQPPHDWYNRDKV